MIAKRLAPDRHVVAASPTYMAKWGRPQRAEELSKHSCLILGDRSQWAFSRNGVESTVRVSGPLRSNNGELLCQAALDGNGLIRASELEILPELNSGQLVHVLPDYEVMDNVAVWALYPSAKHMLPRMRMLLDFLTDWFRYARGKSGHGSPRRTSILRENPARAIAG